MAKKKGNTRNSNHFAKDTTSGESRKSSQAGTNKGETSATERNSPDSRSSTLQTGEHTPAPSAIVAIGCGVGGIDALEPFFKSTNDHSNVTFLIVKHLSTHEDDALNNLIQRLTPLPVKSLSAEPASLKANQVYMLPKKSMITVGKAGFGCAEENDAVKRSGAIDCLFQSLANHSDVPIVGIVLSGSGKDGTLGLKAIRSAHGMTIAQNTESAIEPDMPRSASKSGNADHTLAPGKMPELIQEFVGCLQKRLRADGEENVFLEIKSLLPEMCDALLQVTEHDFRNYKDKTLLRRIARRMLVLRVDSAADYLRRVRSDREECKSLFRELLISVTAFFRDPDVFAYLANYVLPKIVEERTKEDRTIRIWVPGCASGEEAYTLAIMMIEELDKYSDQEIDFTIFATDIDERALNLARSGVYPAASVEKLSKKRVDRFFTKTGNQLTIKKAIRERCVFSLHNLISDTPFSKMDLISCRNLLIYLGQSLQLKLIPTFHFALRANGFLLLGPSESLTSHTEIFKPIDSKHRISQRRPGPARTSDFLSSANGVRAMRERRASNVPDDSDIHKISQGIVLDEFAPKYGVVDENGYLVCTSTGLEQFLEFPDGAFRNNIVKMAKRGLRSVLRASFNAAKKTLRTVVRSDVYIRTESGRTRIKLIVQPMPKLGENTNLFMVVFKDLENSATQIAGGDRIVAADGEALVDQLEIELEQTRSQLEDSIQQVEGSNEELKSSNEELRSINEELQSTNEELETSKEEIQVGMKALARAKSDLQNLLDGTQIATVFLDEDLCIRGFTPAILEIYPLKDTDIGRPIALFVPEVDNMPAMPDPATLTLQIDDIVVARSGKSYVRRVLPYRKNNGEREGIVVTFIDVTKLEKRELELAEAKSRLHLAMQEGGVAAWSWDTNSNQVVADHNLKRMFGFEEDDHVTAKQLFSLIEQPHRSRVQAALENAARLKKPFNEEFSISLKSGEVRWVESRGRAVGSAQDYFGVIIDITNQKNWELKISESEERMRLAAYAAKFASYDIDLSKDFIVWTPELAEILGQEIGSLAQAKASQMVEFLHDEDRETWQMAVDGSYHVDGEGRLECEFRVNEKDGSSRWVLGRGETIFEGDGPDRKAVRAVGVLMDIDDRKQTERQITLIESERDESAMRLSMALRSGGMATWEWTPHESYWSKERYELLGISADVTPSPETFFQCVHPDDLEQMKTDWEKATNGEQSYRKSFRIVHPDGNIRWIEVVSDIVKDDTGKVLRIYGLNWDSTEEHRYKEALEESKQKAQQASIAKTEFLANMSHEIRTPMSAILGYADILAQHLEDPDNVNCVQIIQQNGRFLLEIINDILDISKIEAGKLELMAVPFRVDRLLSDVFALMQVRAVEKDLDFSMSVEGRIPEQIVSDSKRLKQILFNLIGNAIKFTDIGSVELKVHFEDGVVSAKSGNATSRLVFELTDTGIGMSERQLGRLFQAFMQGDPSVARKFGGTGLGLAISQRLAEMLGGKVSVESESGKGSTFTFYVSTGSLKNIQMVDGPTLKIVDLADHESLPIKKVRLRGKILVVDDRREICLIAQHFISAAGGTVETGENGQQAIDLIVAAESKGEPFDLLVLDMQMPVLDGYEATRRLRSNNYDKPIIALTAHAMEGDRTKCLEAGCTEYFAKPLVEATFIALLSQYLTSTVETEKSSSGKMDPISRTPAFDKKSASLTASRSILIVDDNRNACEAVGTLLELSGHEVLYAYDGTTAIEIAIAESPDFIFLDLGLPDVSGIEVVKTLKKIPTLTGTFVIALTGREDSHEIRDAGFDDYVRKPVDVNNVEKMIQTLRN